MKTNEGIMFVDMPAKPEFGLQGGYRVMIHSREASDDANVGIYSLTGLVGKSIPFMVTEVDLGVEYSVVGSRRAAQAKIKAQMQKEMMCGKIFDGRITNFSATGTFLEINGITGFLRNCDSGAFTRKYTRNINEEQLLYGVALFFVVNIALFCIEVQWDSKCLINIRLLN